MNTYELDTKSLQEKLADSGWPKVSLYIPTPTALIGQGFMKNQLAAAEEMLLARTRRRTEARDARKILQEGRRLQKDPTFWNRGTKGVCFFVDEHSTSYLRLPFEVPAEAHVGEAYFVSHLAPLLTEKRPLFAIGVHKDAAQIFRIHKMSADELPPTEIVLPTTAGEESQKKELQFRSVRAGSADHAGFFATGDQQGREQELMARTMRSLAGVCQTSLQEGSTLFLFGAPDAVATLRELTEQMGFKTIAHHGDIDFSTVDELHETISAHEAVVDFWAEQSGASNYAELPPALKLDNVAKIEAAAETGKVQTLIVPQKAWKRKIELENAVRKVLKTGGDIFVAPQAKDVRAILRY